MKLLEKSQNNGGAKQQNLFCHCANKTTGDRWCILREAPLLLAAILLTSMSCFNVSLECLTQCTHNKWNNEQWSKLKSSFLPSHEVRDFSDSEKTDPFSGRLHHWKSYFPGDMWSASQVRIFNTQNIWSQNSGLIFISAPIRAKRFLQWKKNLMMQKELVFTWCKDFVSSSWFWWGHIRTETLIFTFMFHVLVLLFVATWVLIRSLSLGFNELLQPCSCRALYISAYNSVCYE